jgi:hypothetical protein
MKILRRQFLHLAAVLLRSLPRLPSAKFLVEAMRLTALNKSASTDQWPLGQGQAATPMRRQSPCPEGIAGALCPAFHADARDLLVAGSIYSDVPVKPVWLKPPTENRSPHAAERGESISKPRPKRIG